MSEDRVSPTDLERLAAEIERLTEALATCRELREFDRAEIERLRNKLERANDPTWEREKQ